jgi:hypothetical protein
MGEVKDPGFSILPHNNHIFKDGISYENKRIIKLFEKSDSACAQWAIAVIKGESK